MEVILHPDSYIIFMDINNILQVILWWKSTFHHAPTKTCNYIVTILYTWQSCKYTKTSELYAKSSLNYIKWKAG